MKTVLVIYACILGAASLVAFIAYGVDKAKAMQEGDRISERVLLALAVYGGAVGAFFGPVAVLYVIVVSSFVGALVGGVLIMRGKAKLGGFTAVPFGPFLALGTVSWMFWGPRIVNWYLHLHAFVR